MQSIRFFLSDVQLMQTSFLGRKLNSNVSTAYCHLLKFEENEIDESKSRRYFNATVGIFKPCSNPLNISQNITIHLNEMVSEVQ